MIIRDAQPKDVDGITSIYNDAVAHTTAVWNEVTVDVDNRRLWLADRQRLGYPVLVALDEADGVLGYASFLVIGARGTVTDIPSNTLSMYGAIGVALVSDRH